jgi:phosphoglycolate phosphatase-like HAD superfamily hydrolase
MHRIMDVAAIAFDVNGTLIEIRTEDDREDAFRAVGHFLTYQGIDLRRHQIRDLYFQRLKAQQRDSAEQYPEFDAVRIWRSIIEDHASDYTQRDAARTARAAAADVGRDLPRCDAPKAQAVPPCPVDAEHPA